MDNQNRNTTTNKQVGRIMYQLGIQTQVGHVSWQVGHLTHQCDTHHKNAPSDTSCLLQYCSTRRINSCWGWCSNTRCHNNLTQSLINDHSHHNKTPEPYPSEDDWVTQDRTTGSVESGVKTKRGWDATSPPEQDSSMHMWNSIDS